MWEGVGDWTELQHFDSHSYGHQRCVFLVLQRCSTGDPGAQLSAESRLSLPHLVNNGSGLQTNWLLVSPSYIIVKSPIQYLLITSHRDVSLPLSLEWRVWLSSSGNNCHAVHRSLSSGASVWLYRGILPCPILSAKPAYANGICNFHVFGMACLAGSKVNIQHMFHSFFNSLARSKYLFFQFNSVISRNGKIDNFANSLFFFFFLLSIIRSVLLAEIRWSVCTSKSHRSLCVSFSRTGARLCICHLFVWSYLNFLHIFYWITLSTQSCLVLYSFCANLLHSFIMWLMVSSLSPHSLHLLFCCVLSILVLIWWVLIALLCAAIRRDSVSLLRFPFLRHVQVFSFEMLYISRLKRP